MVDGLDMYEMVRTAVAEVVELKTVSDSKEFILYTFTFG